MQGNRKVRKIHTFSKVFDDFLKTIYAHRNNYHYFFRKSFFTIAKIHSIKTGEVIGIGALAFIALGLVNKVNAAITLIFFPGNVQGISFQGINPVLTFSVIVQNTSNVDVTINSIAGNVLSNTELIGNVSTFVPVYLRANSQNVVTLTSQLSALGVVNDLIRTISTGSFSQDIQFTGFANVSGYQMPINVSYNVGLQLSKVNS